MFGAVGSSTASRSAYVGTTRKIHGMNLGWSEKHAAKFIEAVTAGDVKAMKKVLTKNIDVNEYFRFEDGLEKMTALHYASQQGQVEVVRTLLGLENVDVNLKTPFDQSSPLLFAAQCKNQKHGAEIAVMLIKQGADVNAMDHCSCTPLIISAQSGNLELVKLLCQSGAQMDHRMGEADIPNVIRHRLSREEVSARDADEACDPFLGNNALLQSCREHHSHVTHELLRRGSNPNTINSTGNTPLHIAAKSESRFSYSHTTLQRAPVSGNFTIVKTLLEFGCALEATNRHRETALQRAIDGINELFQWTLPQDIRLNETLTFLNITQLFIQVGSDVTCRDEFGNTCLTNLLENALHLYKLDRDFVRPKLLHCAKMLILAGCPVSLDLHKEQLQGLTDYKKLWDFMRDCVRTPLTLKQLTRIAIRKYCRKPLHNQKDNIHVPAVLYKYIVIDML